MIIGIVHSPNSPRGFINDLLKSLEGIKYPVYIVCNGVAEPDINHPIFSPIANPHYNWELGALKKLTEISDDEDIFLIQETVTVKDQAIFDLVAHEKGSVAIAEGFYYHLGKYKRSILEKVGIPLPQTKGEAIDCEYFWNMFYAQNDPDICMITDYLKDSDVFEEKCGRLNMIVENQYVKKYKSNWGQSEYYNDGSRILQTGIINGRKVVGYDITRNA